MTPKERQSIMAKNQVMWCRWRKKMVNIWDCVNSKRLKITDKDGGKYEGVLVCVMDIEENGREEDDITIQTDKGICISFLQSEIAKIEIA